MNKLNEILHQIGFSKYEVALLTYLYKHRASTAEDLAKNTQIPKTRVYDTMDQLVSKGFASVSNSRPRLFWAVSPTSAAQTFLSRRHKEMEDSLQSLENTLQEFVQLSQPLFLESNTTITAEELLFQFSTLEEAENKTFSLIHNAEEEIRIFTNVFHWFDKFKGELETALARGIKIKVLMQKRLSNPDIDSLMNKYPNFQIKISAGIQSKFRGTLVDGKEVVFIIWASEPSGENVEKRIFRPQFSSNSGIVSLFQNNFDYLWSLS